MIIIPGVQVDGIYGPSQPIPDTAVYVEFDGSNYHVYIPGDTLPSLYWNIGNNSVNNTAVLGS